MCWTHIQPKVVKKIESIVKRMDQKELIEDTEVLQLAQSERIFTKASNLLIKN